MSTGGPGPSQVALQETIQSPEIQQAIAQQKQQQEAERGETIESRLGAVREARQEDLAEGRGLGEELFGEGSLRRLEERRSEEIADIIGRRRGISETAGQRSALIEEAIRRRQAGLEGFTPEEQQALREESLTQIGRGEQTALRQLRGIQGAAGIRGGLAGAQQAQVLSQSQAARTQAERELFLSGAAERRRALGAFETSARAAETEEFGRTQEGLGALEESTRAARADELQRQQINIQQQQRERFGRLGAQLGFAQLGSAERASVAQTLLGEQQAEAEVEIARQSGKK